MKRARRPSASREIIVTVHHEMAKFLLETGNFATAITEYEYIVSILSKTTGSETALAWVLIGLGEAYLRAGKNQSGYEQFQCALNIARRLHRQDLVTKAEEFLNRKQT